MIDRANALIVVLEHDTSVDDLKELKNAIAMFKGVLTVSDHVINIDHYVAEERAKSYYRNLLSSLLA